MWGGTDADIYVELARYHTVAGRIDEAMACLRKAASSGWCDLSALDTDPLLGEVRSHADYGEVRQVISRANWPP